MRSYSSPFNFGHRALENLFDGDVWVQEKIDGSQISFGVIDGELQIRSRRQRIDLDNPNKMFALGVEYIKSIQDRLMPGWTYRGEYLSKPKHNTLVYGRIPIKSIILFDIDMGDQDYIEPYKVKDIAARLGLEYAPMFERFLDKPTKEELDEYLAIKSILGDVEIEGVVLKNYSQYGPDKKVLMAKYVSPKFKESHQKDWAVRHPNRNDVITQIVEEYTTEARWLKAIQHLQEEGKIEGVVQDIPIVLNEVKDDIFQEHEDEIKERLFKLARSDLAKGFTRGLPEYYKNYLVEEALGD